MREWLKHNAATLIAAALLGAVVTGQFTIRDRLGALEARVDTAIARSDLEWERDRSDIIGRLERLEALHLINDHMPE